MVKYGCDLQRLKQALGHSNIPFQGFVEVETVGRVFSFCKFVFFRQNGSRVTILDMARGVFLRLSFNSDEVDISSNVRRRRRRYMQDLSDSRDDSEVKSQNSLLRVILGNLFAFSLIFSLIVIAALVWIARPGSDALTGAFIGVIGVIGAMMLKALYFDPKKDRAAKARKEEEEKKKEDELKKQLHKAIYSEMGRTYGETKGNMRCLKKNIKKSLRRSTGYEVSEHGAVPSKSYKDAGARWSNPIEKGCFDLYDGVRIGNSALFYQLSDALAIDSFYSLLKDALAGMPSDSEKTAEITVNDVEFAFFLIEFSLWMGGLEIDLWLLRDCTPVPYTEYINELINRADALLPIEILKERRANSRVINYFASPHFERTVLGLGHKRKDFDLSKFMKAFNDSQQKSDCTLVDAIVKGLEAIPNATCWLATPLEQHDPKLVKLASMIRDQLPLQYTIFDQEEKWLNSATLNVRYSTVNKTKNERQMLDSTYTHFASIDDATNYVDQMDKTGCWPHNIDPAETTLYQKVTGKTPTAFKHYVRVDPDDQKRGGWLLQNDDVVVETRVTPL